MSVYGSPGAVPSLHYAVPLVGVTDPVTLYIHRELRNQIILPPSKSMTNHLNCQALIFFIVSDELSEVTAGHSEYTLYAYNRD